MNSPSAPLWQKNPALAWREIDGETVIISPGDSVMHELNDTGSFIWKHVDGQRTAAEIAALLRSEYIVTSEIALADTEALLEELAGQRLVVLAANGSAGDSSR